MNYRKILIAIFAILHITALAYITIYNNKTKAVSTIEITSNTTTTIICTTPRNNKIIHDLSDGDTLIMHFRPWQNINIQSNNQTYTINFESKQGKTNQFHNANISYTLLKKSDITFFGIIHFFIITHPWLLTTYIIGILLFIFLLIITPSHQPPSLRFIKRRIYRCLLNSKSISHKNNTTAIQPKKYETIWLVILTILTIFVLYLNLGKYPFGQDAEEKRRALVSLEMKISNNYIVPTTNGENYYNKPPLFNWFLTPVIQSKNVELYTRAISVSILILVSIAIFLLLYKTRGWQHALLVSLLFLGSWHVMSYVSFLINIDVLFALLLVPIFYLNFHLTAKKAYLKMFLIGYTLFALAFLTKGLPAIWFFYLSLFFTLLLHKKLKLLFTWQHLAGISIAFIITFGFFGIYSLYTDPLPYLKQMINEISISGRYNIIEKANHILNFPADNIKAYLPASILLPILFYKRNIIKIIKNKEFTYLLLLALIGCIAFLSSPYYMAYYILMLIPLFIDLVISLVPELKRMTIVESLKLPLGLFIIFVPYSIIYGDKNIGTILIIIGLAIIIALFRKHIITDILK